MHIVEFKRCDIDGNGYLNAFDAAGIDQWLVGTSDGYCEYGHCTGYYIGQEINEENCIYNIDIYEFSNSDSIIFHNTININNTELLIDHEFINNEYYIGLSGNDINFINEINATGIMDDYFEPLNINIQNNLQVIMKDINLSRLSNNPVKVDYQTTEDKQSINSSILTFDIDKGERVKISKIIIHGRKLRKNNKKNFFNKADMTYALSDFTIGKKMKETKKQKRQKTFFMFL